jgi:hypothetical protein
MQSGFRAGHGCTSVTLKVLNDIMTAIDKRHYCAAVFIDLSKALDSVIHHTLIGRLNSLGFSNDCLARFTNYFSDRVQCVKSEGLLSGNLAVSMGVPQGSVLGPTLFFVYIYKYLGVWLDCKLTLSISNSKLNLESASYFTRKHPSLILPNIPS